VNYLLEVFDLTTRKVTHQFNSGLPSTSVVSMRMSLDGSQVFMGNGLGSNVILDTLYGNILTTFKTTGGSVGFGGLPGN
jgi:hypothetical protein